MIIDRNNREIIPIVLYDRTLLWLMIGLITIGFIMVTSASMPVGQRISNDPFFFAKREAFHLLLIFCTALITLRVPISTWQRYSNVLLLIVIMLLLIVLEIGISINGAARWISLWSFHIQPSELSKLSLFCYLSNYLSRKAKEVRNYFWGFFKPLSVMIILALLLLAQPDLGTVVILFFTTLSLLFLAGAKIWQFFLIIGSGIVSIAIFISTEHYCIRRIISFWNPWKDPFGNGYQLTQSLMALGRGKFLGQGLGNSIQKLEYLPEAHTDFIFSIIGEELGYIGVVLILLMIFFIAFRAMYIGQNALEINRSFSGFLAFSIGIWFSFQSLINIGATVGILPTKGLTLPLISYGGSSLMTMSTAIILLLRIDYEIRMNQIQAFVRGT